MVKFLSAYRVTFAFLIFLLLGAVSTIPIWVSISTIGRPVALGLLFAITLHTTWRKNPLYSLSSRIVFSLLHLLLLTAFFSAVWSVDRRETLITAIGILLLLLIIQLSSTRRWRDLPTLVADLKVLVWVNSLVLLAGLVSHFLGLVPSDHGGRLQGLLNNPNIAALVAVLTLMIGWGIYKENSNFFSFLVLIPCALTVLLTESRTALIAIGLALIWIVVKSGIKGIVTFFGIGTGIFIILKKVGTGPLEGVLSRLEEGVSENDGLSGRTTLWEAGLGQIKSMPFGAGWGTNTAIVKELGGYSNYHNSYIQTAVEGGIIATAILILIYLTILLHLIVMTKTGLSAGVGAAFIVGIVIQFTESSVFGVGQPYPYLFWASVGALLAINTKESIHQAGGRSAPLLAPIHTIAGSQGHEQMAPIGANIHPGGTPRLDETSGSNGLIIK